MLYREEEMGGVVLYREEVEEMGYYVKCVVGMAVL